MMLGGRFACGGPWLASPATACSTTRSRTHSSWQTTGEVLSADSIKAAPTMPVQMAAMAAWRRLSFQHLLCLPAKMHCKEGLQQRSFLQMSLQGRLGT